MLVPNLRHPLTQASAIATLEQLAPGRVVVAIGTGFTGPHGDGAEGAHVGVHAALHRAGARAAARREGRGRRRDRADAARRRLRAARSRSTTPIVVAANGPKGIEVAHELGDGVMTIGAGDPTFDWCSVLAFGTVLDDGESPGSERALAAAGPALTVVYHAMYEGDPASVDGAARRHRVAQALEEIPESERHLAVHDDHLVRGHRARPPAARRRPVEGVHVDGRRRRGAAPLDALEAAGATEILYAPMGPDIPRELRTFMEMATGLATRLTRGRAGGRGGARR